MTACGWQAEKVSTTSRVWPARCVGPRTCCIMSNDAISSLNRRALTSPSLSFQSAYHKCHSTETALVKIHNDIISAIDHGNLGALVTLDFSSAFDTVDHRTFLSILQQRFGVTDSALNWFNSYLSQNYRLVYPTQLQFTVVFLKIPLSATYSEFQPSLFC